MTTPVIETERLGPEGQFERDDFKPSELTEVEGEVTRKPLLPPEVDLSDKMRQKLIEYLDDQLWRAESERGPWLSKIARLKRKYRAEFPDQPKDFPIANASQITIPIIKTAVNTTVTRLYQTIMAAEPPVSLRAEDDNFQAQVFDYERFLDQYSDEKLDIATILDTWVTEVVMLGTGVLEVTTATDRRAIMNFDPVEGEYRKETVDVHSGPVWYNVPLEDYWQRPAYKSVEAAPWVGKAIRPTWSEIKAMALSGELNPDEIDNIWKFTMDIGDAGQAFPEGMKVDEEAADLEPNDREQYRIFELSVRWDTDGDGIEEELLVYFHWESRTLLRVKYNGFRSARRPWIVAQFVGLPHWIYGEGLAEMLEHLQEEISTTHNQRIDNATLANLRIILTRKLIKGLRPGDRLWSGKVIRVNDVAADVGTLQLSDIYPSTVTNEQLALQYVERLSAIGAAATGTAQPVSRTTATAQMALLEELNRRFDKTIKSMRRAIRQAFNYTSDLFVQLGTGGLAELWLGEEAGSRLDEFLRLPHGILQRKFKIRVLATQATINREVELQTNIAVFQLILQLWMQVRGEAAQLAPQIIPLLAHEMVQSLIPVYRKIMQYADAPDPDQAISVLTTLERILPAPEDLGGMDQARATENMDRLAEALAQQQGAAGGEGVPGNGQGPPPDQELTRLAALLGTTGGVNR